MKNEFAFSHGPSWCPGMEVHTMWHVDVNHDYQVKRSFTASDLVAIRTVGGQGLVQTTDHGEFRLAAGALLIAEMRQLQFSGTVGDHWEFYWWEFERGCGIGLPWHELLTIFPNAWEEQAIATIFRLLGQSDDAARMAASALFNAIVHEWSTRWRRESERRAPSHALVEHAIDSMQNDLSQPLAIDAIAQQCGVSSRWLRQVFTEQLGVSPKQYYQRLRLTWAASALRMGLGTVSELSEQLGYSSPLYFSRAFKTFFGVCPSHYAQQ